MGILDDAIREHLELKRQRGATESELKQLEDEAFGPPSRPGDAELAASDLEHSENGIGADAAGSEPHDAYHEAGAEPSAVEHPVVEPDSEELTTILDQTPGGEQGHDDLDLEEPPPAETEPEEHPGESDDVVEPEDHLEPDEPQEDTAPDAPVESLDTAEHPGAEEMDEPEAMPEEHAAEDDVLADTPEFLKDAPEDDELWFEQGKPKDFDF